MAIHLLKDFLCTLASEFGDNLRFDYFMDLCGLYEIKHKGGKDLKSYISANKIKLICKSLPETCRFFYRMILEIKSGKKTSSDFFMPNHENNNNYLIPVAEAERYTDKILRDENFPASSILKVCSDLGEIAEKDLYSRILRNRITNQAEGAKNKFISFDAYVSYLLEIFVGRMMKRLGNLHSNLVMFCKSRYESRMTMQNFKYSVRRSLDFLINTV